MSILDFIKDLDINSVAPLLESIGMPKKVIETLCSDDFKCALSGNVTIKQILPLALPLIQAFLEKRAKNTSNDYNEHYPQTNYSNFERLSPIKEIAGDTITNAFEKYFT